VLREEAENKNREELVPRMHLGRALLCAAALGNFFAVPAHANFTCEGQIAYLGITPNGNLYVSVGFGIWNMCNLTTTTQANGGVVYTPEGCRSWYAAILAAQKTAQPVRFYFESSAVGNNGPECVAIGSWVQPNPASYFMVVL
jgi:hypothetical protein